MNNNDIINQIWQHCHYTGNLLFSLQASRVDERGYVLLPTLFIILERVLKFGLCEFYDDSKIDYIHNLNLKQVINESYKRNIINKNEKNFLSKTRLYRNTFFHSFIYNLGIENNGKIAFVYENDTHIDLYDLLLPNSLNIILKILSR